MASTATRAPAIAAGGIDWPRRWREMVEAREASGPGNFEAGGSRWEGRAERFARLCRSAGLRHRRTRPYTPRTNGKAERFIQTLLREWAYRRAYPSSRARTDALPAWLYYYNWERGHSALHGRPPIRCLAAPNNLMAVHS